MKKLKLRNNILEAVLVLVILNVLTLLLWILLRLMPLINGVSYIDEQINLNKYNNLDELLLNINEYESEYDIKFSVIYDGNEIQNGQTREKDTIVFSTVVKIEDEYYIIKGYYEKVTGIMSLFIELVVIQLVIILIYILVVYMLAKTKVIEPIEHVINDIKNYKFGFRPKKKNIVNNEFGLLQNEFIDLIDSLEKEKSEQSRIITSISHDIKTPLTSIIGYSTLINDSNLSKEEICEYNKKIQEKSLHIKNILNTFDDYLVNQNNQVLNSTDILIGDLTDYLISEYALELKDINIDFEIETNIKNEIINVDVLKLKRIFANVISNSVRYLENCGKITILVNKNKKEYIFIIKDNGPGVKDSVIDKVFDPLFTTDTSRKISGLGLSIVKEFVEMHKGKVRAYNENGFVIEFTIPINKKG